MPLPRRVGNRPPTPDLGPRALDAKGRVRKSPAFGTHAGDLVALRLLSSFLCPALSFPWLTLLARPPPSPAWPSHAGPHRRGLFHCPVRRVGDLEDFNVRTSLAGAVYHNDRTPWEMLLSFFGPSEVAANYLRVIRLDTLPEFAAVARDEDEFLAVCVRPYLEGCRSPGTGSLLRCPVETARHDSWALTKMWQHARRQHRLAPGGLPGPGLRALAGCPATPGTGPISTRAMRARTRQWPTPSCRSSSPRS